MPRYVRMKVSKPGVSERKLWRCTNEASSIVRSVASRQLEPCAEQGGRAESAQALTESQGALVKEKA